jgi:hypothetical protein
VLKEIYENSTFPKEQHNYLLVMGCVKDSDWHAEMLEYMFNSGRVHSQDIAFSLGSLTNSMDIQEGAQLGITSRKTSCSSIQDLGLVLCGAHVLCLVAMA